MLFQNDDFDRGYEWNDTDRWVHRRLNNNLGDYLSVDGLGGEFPSAEEVRDEEEYKGLDEDIVSAHRVSYLVEFDMAMKTLSAIHPHIAPDAEIDKDEVWKWVWKDCFIMIDGKRMPPPKSDASKFFYVSPLIPHIKE